MVNSEDDKKKSVAVDDELSLEDIDAVLAEEDPEFAKQVDKIAQDKNLSFTDIVLTEEEQALADERERWEKSNRFFRTLHRVWPGVAYISLAIRKIKAKTLGLLRSGKDQIKNFLVYLVTDGRKKLIGAIKGFFSRIGDSVNRFGRYFRFLPWTTKALFVGTVALAVGTGLFIFKSMTTGVIKLDDELFVPSLEKVAHEIHEYNPETETEAFYENLRVANNLLLMTKMVVNLRPSTQSGRNPMGAFEFFVEGGIPEVIVEIKDRETEIRDRMQRSLEELTFDQVDSVEGKEFMLEKLQKEINSVLTTGKVKRIFIKTAIVKP